MKGKRMTKLPAIEIVCRRLGRARDGYGGVSELARLLGISVLSPQRWRKRGWINREYAKRISDLTSGVVTEAQIVDEAKAGDKRRISKNP